MLDLIKDLPDVLPEDLITTIAEQISHIITEQLGGAIQKVDIDSDGRAYVVFETDEYHELYDEYGQELSDQETKQTNTGFDLFTALDDLTDRLEDNMEEQ